ncbi:hypothetical protein C2E23DRAFT_857098 [Lenzites betulinus]|nr:hypothetical protein C2E23DRAFT_857098 [Lenzites betulinus]
MPSPKSLLPSLSLSDVFVFSTILSFSRAAVAVQVTRTIDDEQGDIITGTKPIYTPADGWSQGATCTGCSIDSSLIDASQVLDGTWHSITSGTDERTITVTFTGVAVNAFFVIARPMPSTLAQTNLTFTLDPEEGPDADTDTTLQFPALIDGEPVYSARMFGVSGLPNREHTLKISSAGPTNNLYAFDYVQYVADEDDSPSHVGFVGSDARCSNFKQLFCANSRYLELVEHRRRDCSTHDLIFYYLFHLLGVVAFLLWRRRLRERPRTWIGGNATDDGADGLTILPALFAQTHSESRASSEGSLTNRDAIGNGTHLRRSSAPYPTDRQDTLGNISGAHASRISLPPSYAPQRASSPSGMSHHTALPPYSSAPPSLAHAGARRYVELTRLIRVLEGQLAMHDALHLSRSLPPQVQTQPGRETATPPKARPEKAARRARPRGRAETRRRAEEEEHRSRRERLAALLSELTEARALLAEEAPALSGSGRGIDPAPAPVLDQQLR